MGRDPLPRIVCGCSILVEIEVHAAATVRSQSIQSTLAISDCNVHLNFTIFIFDVLLRRPRII
eukprot:m.256238 g.256238  ORF g.256238 m.256238 type:complete len:63 (+) comp15951_c0_seq4:1991-2179(+)